MSDYAFQPDPIDIEVGLRIRRLRTASKISQEVLGAAIGVTFQQIQKYERGTNRVSASMMVRIARRLGVAASDLLPDDGAEPLPKQAHLIARTRGAEELLEKYAAIRSTQSRRAVLDLVRAMAAEDAALVVAER